MKASCPPKGTSIERRPKEVSTRSTFGHWELDSVIGKAKGRRQSLLVLTERMTRCELILRAPNKTSAATVHAVEEEDYAYVCGSNAGNLAPFYGNDREISLCIVHAE